MRARGLPRAPGDGRSRGADDDLRLHVLFSGITTTDNVHLGHSYFYSEVRRVREAAELLREGKRALVVFDEIFKGTNVRDALDASRAVLTGFARAPNGVFIISSHLAELADELRGPPEVDFRFFNATLSDGALVFSHELKEGTSAQRLGMVLLERERVLELLGVERAAD